MPSESRRPRKKNNVGVGDVSVTKTVTKTTGTKTTGRKTLRKNGTKSGGDASADYHMMKQKLANKYGYFEQDTGLNERAKARSQVAKRSMWGLMNWELVRRIMQAGHVSDAEVDAYVMELYKNDNPSSDSDYNLIRLKETFLGRWHAFVLERYLERLANKEVTDIGRPMGSAETMKTFEEMTPEEKHSLLPPRPDDETGTFEDWAKYFRTQAWSLQMTFGTVENLTNNLNSWKTEKDDEIKRKEKSGQMLTPEKQHAQINRLMPDALTQYQRVLAKRPINGYPQGTNNPNRGSSFKSSMGSRATSSRATTPSMGSLSRSSRTSSTPLQQYQDLLKKCLQRVTDATQPSQKDAIQRECNNILHDLKRHQDKLWMKNSSELPHECFESSKSLMMHNRCESLRKLKRNSQGPSQMELKELRSLKEAAEKEQQQAAARRQANAQARMGQIQAGNVEHQARTRELNAEIDQAHAELVEAMRSYFSGEHLAPRTGGSKRRTEKTTKPKTTKPKTTKPKTTKPKTTQPKEHFKKI